MALSRGGEERRHAVAVARKRLRQGPAQQRSGGEKGIGDG